MVERKRIDLQMLFLRWQDGRLSEKEEERLQHWLQASEENRKTWEGLKSAWDVAAPPAIPEGSPQEKQWERLVQRIEGAGLKSELQIQPSFSFTGWLRKLELPLPRLAAAGIALALLFVVIEFGGRFLGTEMQTVHVPPGQRQSLELSDGTRIQLNAGTTFHYPKNFDSDIRHVELAGEAYFHVAQTATPFVVRTEHATTTVTGTEFNIKAREYKTVVFVKKGRVQVTPNDNIAQKIMISEGEIATAETQTVQKKVAEHHDSILAWREGRLVFHRQPLPDVLAEIERFYNIEIEADSTLLHHTVTASFGQEPPSQIVETLALALDARTRKQDEHYYLVD